jgi:hypothetical protein
MNKRIKLGMVGGGEGALIGIVHRIAAYMTERYDLVGGIFNSDFERSKMFDDELGLWPSRVYQNVEDLIINEQSLPEHERIELVTVATPNFLHFDAVRKLLIANFHVFCEKPITMTVEEAVELQRLVESKKLIFGVAHTYTGYPMVRQMREMIAAGEIGDLQKIDAQYYQGWINPFIHEKERRKEVWRLDPEKSGISCCMGDIGVHAFNMIEYVSGKKVHKILADLSNFYSDNELDVDGSVLFRTDDNIRGLIRASQVATGEENNFRIAVYGKKGALKWEQENPNYLYFLKEGKPMETLKPGNPYSSDFEKQSIKLPAGHPEGIFDAMGNIYMGLAKAIRNEPYKQGSFPTIEDGVRGMKYIYAAVSSSGEGNKWKSIE